MTKNEVKNGEVIWYNERNGYGFVKIDNAEVFLHRSTLDRFGLIRLLTGDQVSVSLATNEHGQVIQDLLTIERPANPAPPTASEPDEGEMRAVVKFFNDIRSYSFVTTEDLNEDVFVHSRVLNDCRFHSLMQAVAHRFRPFGFLMISLRNKIIACRFFGSQSELLLA